MLKLQVVWGRSSLLKFCFLVSQAFCDFFALSNVPRSIPVGDGKCFPDTEFLPTFYENRGDGGESPLKCSC